MSAERELPTVREVIVTVHLMGRNSKGGPIQSMSRRTLYFPTHNVTMEMVISMWNRNTARAGFSPNIVLPPLKESSAALFVESGSRIANLAIRNASWPEGVKSLDPKGVVPNELAIIFFDFVREDVRPSVPASVFNLAA